MGNGFNVGAMVGFADSAHPTWIRTLCKRLALGVADGFAVGGGALFEEEGEVVPEVVGVSHAGDGGDFGDGEVGFGQQALGAFHANASDFVVGGGAEGVLEFAFECAAVDADGVDDIGDGDEVAGAFVDEAKGGGEGAVGDGEGV